MQTYKGVNESIKRLYRTTDGTVFEDQEKAYHHQHRLSKDKLIADLVYSKGPEGLNAVDLIDFLKDNWVALEDIMRL